MEIQAVATAPKPARIKSDLTIRGLPPTTKRLEHPDERITGLYLVQQPSGARSWAVRYRVAGAPKKLTLGSYPAVDLATARKRAQAAIGDVAGGKDPAAAKRASRAAAKAASEAQADRVEHVVDLFIERYAKPNTRDWRNTECMLKVDVVRRWGGKRLAQITRADVHQMLDAIANERKKPIQANRVFAQVRKLCGWAVSKGIIEKSPCDGVAAPSQETQRDRFLSDDEIRLAWRAFGADGWPFGDVAKLLLLTGARRDEIAEGRWNEVDVAARTWTIPKERSKNKREHVIPLSDAAMAIVAQLPRVGDNPDGFMFSTTRKTPISGWSNVKDRLDTAIHEAAQKDDPKAGPLPHWTFHDLRRTLATNMQKLGVKLEVTEAVLNHVSGSRAGIVGIYQRHDYADEKRAALSVWADRLETIVREAR
jgi:integrase